MSIISSQLGFKEFVFLALAIFGTLITNMVYYVLDDEIVGIFSLWNKKDTRLKGAIGCLSQVFQGNSMHVNKASLIKPCMGVSLLPIDHRWSDDKFD